MLVLNNNGLSSESWLHRSCVVRCALFYIRSVAQSGSAPGLGPGGPRFESLYSDQRQRMGYIIQYESQGTAVNPWASNSTYNNVTGGSDLLTGMGLKTESHHFKDIICQCMKQL